MLVNLNLITNFQNNIIVTSNKLLFDSIDVDVEKQAQNTII